MDWIFRQLSPETQIILSIIEGVKEQLEEKSNFLETRIQYLSYVIEQTNFLKNSQLNWHKVSDGDLPPISKEGDIGYWCRLRDSKTYKRFLFYGDRWEDVCGNKADVEAIDVWFALPTYEE